MTHHAADSQKDFSTGKVWRIITAQAVPLTIAQLIYLLYNIVDRIYIGRLPEVGSVALAGSDPAKTLITRTLAYFRHSLYV